MRIRGDHVPNKDILITQAVGRSTTEHGGELMESQNTSGSVENAFPKTISIIFRGIVWGIIGGAPAGILFGVIFGLFETFSFASIHFLPRDLDFLALKFLLSLFVHTIFDIAVALGLPISLVIGLATGILAAKFGYHCPTLRLWLALSWMGVITGYSLGVFPSHGWAPYGLLLGITFISLGASWMAHKSTIQEIKKGVLKEALPRYTILSSLSNLFMIFMMIFPYFYLTNMSS
jgi:hypothetical protein